MGKRGIDMKKRRVVMLFFSLVVVLVCLLLFRFLVPSQKELSVEDACGIVLGKLIHSIRDSDDCSGRCASRCISSDLSYVRHVFTQNASSNHCNMCRCFCK